MTERDVEVIVQRAREGKLQSSDKYSDITPRAIHLLQETPGFHTISCRAGLVAGHDPSGILPLAPGRSPVCSGPSRPVAGAGGVSGNVTRGQQTHPSARHLKLQLPVVA
jgi:hypothetical protein